MIFLLSNNIVQNIRLFMNQTKINKHIFSYSSRTYRSQIQIFQRHATSLTSSKARDHP